MAVSRPVSGALLIHSVPYLSRPRLALPFGVRSSLTLVEYALYPSEVQNTLCSRKRHRLLLFENVVLTEWSIATFVAKSLPAHAAEIRTLTIRLEPGHPSGGPYTDDFEIPLDPDYDPNSEPVPERVDVQSQLLSIASVLKSISTLQSFSIFVSEPRRQIEHLSIASAILSSILHQLPHSCSALELDTRGFDDTAHESDSSGHICEALRHVIPRLHYIRLRLRLTCSCFLSNDVITTVNTTSGSIIGDGSMGPSLKQPKLAIVSFVVDGVSYYDTDMAVYRSAIGHWKAAIERQPGSIPGQCRIRFITRKRHDWDDRRGRGSAYDALYRRELLDDVSWAMPTQDIVRASIARSVLIRLPSGEEYLGGWDDLDMLAEGADTTWGDVSWGARLPYDLIEEQYYELSDGTALTRAAYNAKYPNWSCDLWGNEDLTGLCLLSAKERRGLENSEPVRELVPTGWKSSHGALMAKKSR